MSAKTIQIGYFDIVLAEIQYTHRFFENDKHLLKIHLKGDKVLLLGFDSQEMRDEAHKLIWDSLEAQDG